MSQPYKKEHYQIGIICALHTEAAAVIAMLDERHPKLASQKDDPNDYSFGRIGVHNLVIACLPAGGMGNTPATTVANNMKRSFPIKIGLMVGIGGGVPSKKSDIRLGDIAVSQPTGSHGGVFQWDYGKTEQGGEFHYSGTLDKPPIALLNALQSLKTSEELDGIPLNEALATMAKNKPRMVEERGYEYQGADEDQLFQSTYDHPAGETCENCDLKEVIERKARSSTIPRVFYGNIASGNQVMKHGITRDRIAKKEGVICFEMEAAGLMDNFPCLVIRGICDYADSHKNKIWQPYAAATAAAFARILLSFVEKQEVTDRPASSHSMTSSSNTHRQTEPSKSFLDLSAPLTSESETSISDGSVSTMPSDLKGAGANTTRSVFIDAAKAGDAVLLLIYIRKDELRSQLDQVSVDRALIEICRRSDHTEKEAEAAIALIDKCNANSDYRMPRNGRTPMMWAACFGHVPLVEILLSKGASQATFDESFKRTSLSWAAMQGNSLRVVELLIEKGADIETSDLLGRTPLIWAILRRQYSTVELLLEKGARRNVADGSGRTAEDWARRTENKCDGLTSSTIVQFDRTMNIVVARGHTVAAWSLRARKSAGAARREARGAHGAEEVLLVLAVAAARIAMAHRRCRYQQQQESGSGSALHAWSSSNHINNRSSIQSLPMTLGKRHATAETKMPNWGLWTAAWSSAARRRRLLAETKWAHPKLETWQFVKPNADSSCDKANENRNADSFLLPCDGYNSFCCGQNQAARNCCSTGNGGFAIPAGFAMLFESELPSTMTISTTIIATTTASPTVSPSSTSTAATGNCGPQKTTTIGVGAALGGLILIALAILGFWLSKARRRAQIAGENGEANLRLLRVAEVSRDENQRLLDAALLRIRILEGRDMISVVNSPTDQGVLVGRSS
ncbi:hypothetical protein V501_00366 [Pseudogymnoascus sp. VKM F-4519 (FW-2642)]|nr:hypothetical protein V501_00366 [Pseudogymnoascus sp. VKM F-4519 (FW-2642)]